MRFEDLEAWQSARRLVNAVYPLTRLEPLSKDYGLVSQIQRAAVSIMTNIAEGFQRTGNAEKQHFYNIARASCGEVRSLLYVIEDNFTFTSGNTTNLRAECETVGRLISGLINSTKKRSN